MVSAMRRPEERAKTETATSNPVQRFYTESGQTAVEVQFFVHGPRERVEQFLRAYNDSHEPGHLVNLLRNFRDIIQYCKVDGQEFRGQTEILREVARRLGLPPLSLQ